jgi:hypothetical protein
MTAQQHLALAQIHIAAAAKLMVEAPSPKEEILQRDQGTPCIKVAGQFISVLDYSRKFYEHKVAGWVDDSQLADLDSVLINDEEDFYLVHWHNSKRCAIVFPADSNHDQWRIQEFEADLHIKSFLLSRNAWH